MNHFVFGWFSNTQNNIAKINGTNTLISKNHLEVTAVIFSVMLTDMATLSGTHKNNRQKQMAKLKKPTISIKILFFFILLQ